MPKMANLGENKGRWLIGFESDSCCGFRSWQAWGIIVNVHFHFCWAFALWLIPTGCGSIRVYGTPESQVHRGLGRRETPDSPALDREGPLSVHIVGT